MLSDFDGIYKHTTFIKSLIQVGSNPIIFAVYLATFVCPMNFAIVITLFIEHKNVDQTHQPWFLLCSFSYAQ